LAEELGILKEIIEKVPTAGLWEGQTDEGEIEMSYKGFGWTHRSLRA